MTGDNYLGDEIWAAWEVLFHSASLSASFRVLAGIHCPGTVGKWASSWEPGALLKGDLRRLVAGRTLRKQVQPQGRAGSAWLLLGPDGQILSSEFFWFPFSWACAIEVGCEKHPGSPTSMLVTASLRGQISGYRKSSVQLSCWVSDLISMLILPFHSKPVKSNYMAVVCAIAHNLPCAQQSTSFWSLSP